MSSTFYFAEASAININDDTATVLEKSKGGEIFSLSSTTSIKITQSAKITSSAVEDGNSMVDNYYLDNKVASFDGIISNIKVGGNSITDVGLWISQVESLRKKKVLLVMVADTEVIPHCLISSLSITKTKKEGLSGWKCSISFKEVDISERARLVEIKVPKPEIKDEVAGKVNASGVPTKAVKVSGTAAGLLTKNLITPTTEE